MATLFAAMFLFPLYEQALRGASALDASLLLAPQGLAAMVAMPIGGRLGDIFGPRLLVLSGLAFAAVSTVPFTHLDAGTSQALLALSGIPRGIAARVSVRYEGPSEAHADPARMPDTPAAPGSCPRPAA